MIAANGNSRSGRIARTNGAAPAYRQIYLRIRDAIEAGRLVPGARVPSTRSMASELGYARGTVEEAYQLLAAEGYLVRRGAAGSAVSPELAAHGVARDTPSARSRRLPATPKRASTLPDRRSSPFMMGVPALDAFPKAQWTRIAARQARRLNRSDLFYPNPLGFGPLRESLARYLALGRGIACSPAQIIITAGYKGALELATLVLLKRGDTVYMEDPGYGVASGLLTAMEVNVASVPVDREGICVAAAEAMAADARLAVVTPSHQFPTCVTMSLPRRQALLVWRSAKGLGSSRTITTENSTTPADRCRHSKASIGENVCSMPAASARRSIRVCALAIWFYPNRWSHASRPSSDCAIWGRQRTCRPWPQAL